jgi:hypothetical protein
LEVFVFVYKQTIIVLLDRFGTKELVDFHNREMTLLRSRTCVTSFYIAEIGRPLASQTKLLFLIFKNNNFSKKRNRMKLLAESRVNTLSLRRFVALPKIVQADYQPRRLQDKTAQLQLYTDLLLHYRNRSRITPS